MAKRPLQEIINAYTDPLHPYSCYGCTNLRTAQGQNVHGNQMLVYYDCAKGHGTRGEQTKRKTVHPVAWSDSCKEVKGTMKSKLLAAGIAGAATAIVLEIALGAIIWNAVKDQGE